MTPKQLKFSTTKHLLITYKNKARCYHSKRKADALYLEIKNRLGDKKTRGIALASFHMDNGDGDAEFNHECDKLINLI